MQVGRRVHCLAAYETKEELKEGFIIVDEI